MNIFIPHCSDLLTDHLPHGDGLVAHGFIERLAGRGHQLYVAAERAELAKPFPPNVRLFVFASRSKRAAGRRAEYMLNVRRLYRRLSGQVPFDLIHQLNPVFTGMSLALWGAKVPIVLGPYVADWPSKRRSNSLGGAIGSALDKVRSTIAGLQQSRAEVLLLTTEAARQRIKTRKRKTSYILPHGVDSDYFSPYPSQEESRGNPQAILFLASVVERKGIFDLLEAFERLASQAPEPELWIAGGGEELETAKAAAGKLQCNRRIRFLGSCTRAEALDLLRRATLVCLPSHGEPFGMGIAEAMSCGKPVVVTNAGGLASLVDLEGGLRVPVGSPKDLADALGRILKDEELRRSMSLFNRQKVIETMAWDRVIDRLEAIYRTVLKTGGARTQARVLAQPSIGD